MTPDREISDGGARAVDAHRATPAERSRATAAPPARGAPSNVDGYVNAWFQLAQHRWTSVALVPANRASSVATLANGIAAVATSYGDPVSVVVAPHVVPAAAHALLDELMQRTAVGSKTLVATGSPLADPALVAVARAADACVLVIGLGRTTAAEARQTMACIGIERFIGSIAVT